MLVDLNWDKIPEGFAYELRDLAEKFSEENTYNLMLVGDDQVGKTTFINNVTSVKMKYKHLPTQAEGVELSVLPIGKNLIHIWSTRSDRDIIYNLEETVKMLDGVLAFFDLNNPASYKNMQDRISELILLYEKMYPLILIGNKADKKTLIKKEDVLRFAYELGNCSCHQVPYTEMSALMSYGFEKVITNMISIIGCNMTRKCAEYPAQLRKWCQVPSYYSFYNEKGNTLEILP
ncbi:MAG: ADP-ribosylation factor-like protein [Candidatus Kariarchaeaceae archaeon]|jgi:GTP-binding protein EngB required for normal cell division